jgi:hypothetical protein
VAFLVLSTGLIGCAHSGGGSLAADTGGDFTQGLSVAVGAPVTVDPGIMLINPTRHTLTVQDVRLLRVDPALRFEGWRLDRPRSSGGKSVLMANHTPFPPSTPGSQGGPVVGPSTTRNSAGQLIGDVAVAVGLTLLRAGRYQASGLKVTYRDPSGNHQVTVCTTCRFELFTS